MATGRPRAAARFGALAAVLATLAAWVAGGSAAGIDGSLPGRDAFRVVMEHLVIRPADQGAPGGYEVLDVIQVEPDGEAVPSAALRVPLLPGHEGLRVLDGLEPDTIEVGPRSVSGRLLPTPERPATVALTYRLGPERARDRLTVVRPYPVQTLRIIVHPSVALSVGGADAEGDVDLAGVSYRLYARHGLPAGTPVVLSPLPSAGGPKAAASRRRTAAFALAVAAAAGLGAAGWLASRRRAKEGPARERERLMDEVLALEAEYAAGYLDEPEYRRRRQDAMARLARILRAHGGLGSVGARAGGGPPGGAGP